MKENIKKFGKPVGNVICILSVFFLFTALVRTDFDVSQITDWRSFLFVFAVSTGLKTATVFMSASAWCLWLEFFAKRRCDRREALRVYAKANIGKYLPGNVMHYVERNLFAGKLKLSQKQVAAASICEIVSLVSAAFFTGMLLAFSKVRDTLAVIWQAGGVFNKWAVWLAAVVIPAVLAALYFAGRKKVRSRAAEKKISAADFFSFFHTFAAAFLLYAAVLIVLGLILAVIYFYLGGRPTIRQALEMTAAYMIAWVLGFIIPGAPGGIGVRETALTLLLTPVTGRDMIVVLSVLHRLVTVAGDFTAYLLRKKLWRIKENPR